MAAGLIVYNDGGNIQFTDMYKNFVLLYQGGGTLQGTYTASACVGGPFAYIEVPNSLGYPPPIALYCNTPITLWQAELINNNWRYLVMGPFQSAAGSGFSWWAFGPTPNAVGPTNYGFEVRREDGSMAYHSGYKPMRVALGLGGHGTYDLAGGRTYAYMPTQQYFEQTAFIPAGTWRCNAFASHGSVNGARIVAESRQTYQLTYGFNPPWNPQYTRGDFRGLILDVTNY